MGLYWVGLLADQLHVVALLEQLSKGRFGDSLARKLGLPYRSFGENQKPNFEGFTPLRNSTSLKVEQLVVYISVSGLDYHFEY